MNLTLADLDSKGPEGESLPQDLGSEITLGGLNLGRPSTRLSRRERKHIHRLLESASPEQRKELRRELLGPHPSVSSSKNKVPSNRVRNKKQKHSSKPTKKHPAFQIDLDADYIVLTDTQEEYFDKQSAKIGNDLIANPAIALKKASLPRSVLTVFAWIVVGAATSLATLLALPPLVGYKTMVVLSGSMAPTLDIGDVVIDKTINVLDVKIGDVITFRDPNHSKRTVTHRVRAISVEDGNVIFTTRGDANTGNESWVIPATGRIGRVDFRIPKLGYVLGWAWSPKVRVAFVAIPMAFFGALEIAAIWRTPEDPLKKRPNKQKRQKNGRQKGKGQRVKGR